MASHGSPVADSARIAAALINSFALLLVLASWAAWRGPAIIEVWLEMEFDLINLFNLFCSEVGISDWGYVYASFPFAF